MAAAISQSAIYGRLAGGSWYETNSTWKVSNLYVSTLPGSEDVVSLTADDNMIDLNEASVTVFSMTLGAWESSLTKVVTLNVQSDLSTVNAIFIGAAGNNSGNGAMVVSNAVVTTKGSTLIGKTASGILTLDGGAVFQNTAWRIDMGADATIILNDGTLSMINGLLMVDGATVDINGSSELWLMNNDQTQSSDPLMQYINNGWISGNGLAGNVIATYDGTKTIVTASPSLPQAHLSINCSSSNVTITSIDLYPFASNVFEKCSDLGISDWTNVPPVSIGISSNSWTVPSVDRGEFFRIRSWF
jgi:hypothetical protein